MACFIDLNIIHTYPTSNVDSYSSSEELNLLLAKEDFESIIKNKELFWAQFCSMYAEKSASTELFYVKKTLNSKFLVGG